MTSFPPPHCTAELTVPREIAEDFARWHRKMEFRMVPDGPSTRGLMVVFDPYEGEEESRPEPARLKAWLFLDDREGLSVGDKIEIVAGRCCDPMMMIHEDPGPDDPLIGVRVEGVLDEVREGGEGLF